MQAEFSDSSAELTWCDALDDVCCAGVGGGEEAVDVAESDPVELVAWVDPGERLMVDAVADLAEMGWGAGVGVGVG